MRKCAGHRVLALNRGEAEKYLTVKVLAPEESILKYLDKQIVTKENPFTAPVLREAAEDSYRRLIAPAIEREIRGSLTEKAETLPRKENEDAGLMARGILVNLGQLDIRLLHGEEAYMEGLKLNHGRRPMTPEP